MCFYSLMYFNTCNYSTLISAHTGDILKEYQVPFKMKNGSLNLCSSLNGILCLNEIDLRKIYGSRLEDFKELCLWNSSVRKYQTLFSSCIKIHGECICALG